MNAKYSVLCIVMRYVSLIIILVFCCEAKYIPSDGIYAVADQMPTYKTGMDDFAQYVEEEISDLDAYEKGSVFVSFVVTSNGNLEQLKVVRSISEDQDLLALKLVKEAPEGWKAGVHEGKPVNVKMVYPIKFE
ncbi:MAG: energy transducer TonB [Cyclobacteriaceae bacterium]